MGGTTNMATAKKRGLAASRRGSPRSSAGLALVLLLALVLPGEAFARGGFRGGGFRVAPSRSMSLPRLSLPRAAGRSAPLSPWGSATRPTTTRPAPLPRLSPSSGLGRSSFSSQRSVYDSARRSGTLFSSRNEAQAAFKSRYQGQYGSTFRAEPASRPAWIPQTATVGGRSVGISWNPALGGYGYLDPILGSWILYDVFTDALMVDNLMNHHNYYYGAPVYLSHGPGFLGAAIGLVILMLVLVALSRALGRMGRR
jgi:hypothetical protein